MKAKKLYFMECHLAGRKYHDVDEVWDELRVGTLLELRRDADNPYDHKAVAVVYCRPAESNSIESEEFLLGYIPAGENETIYGLLEMGWTDIFECRISHINPEAHYENQIRMNVRIKRNNASQ